MPCQRCESERVVFIQAHCRDCFNCDMGNGASHDGYVLGDMGIGGGDDVEFDLCMDCGQLQGTFPLGPTLIEVKRGSKPLKE